MRCVRLRSYKPELRIFSRLQLPLRQIRKKAIRARTLEFVTGHDFIAAGSP